MRFFQNFSSVKVKAQQKFNYRAMSHGWGKYIYVRSEQFKSSFLWMMNLRSFINLEHDTIYVLNLSLKNLNIICIPWSLIQKKEKYGYNDIILTSVYIENLIKNLITLKVNTLERKT